MHLLKINKENYIGQADPFILKANGRYYIYTTGHDGIYAYRRMVAVSQEKGHASGDSIQ